LYSDSLCVQSDDGDSLSFSFLDSVKGIVLSDGVISWTPMDNDTGRKAIALRVNNGQGGSDTVRWIITVFPANHSPVFDSSHHPDTIAYIGAAYYDTLFAADSDGDSLRFSLVEGPSRLTIVGHVVTWTPSDSDTGVTRISVQVSDNYGGHETQSRLVLVKPANHAPVFLTADSEMTSIAYINHQYRDTVRAKDQDGDTVTFSMPYPIPGMSITNGIIIWTPQRADLGSKTVQLCASDGRGGRDTLLWTITVSSLTPFFLSTAADMKASATIGSQYLDTLTYLSSAGVTFSFIDSVPGMTLDQDIVQWTPSRSDTGAHTIAVVLSSSGKGCDTLRWVIKIDVVTIPVDSSDTTTVIPENNPPVFISTPASMHDTAYAGVAFTDTIVAKDPDDDPLTYSILSGFDDMIMSDNAIVWTPQISDTGITKEIRIEVSDGNGGSDTLSWNLLVSTDPNGGAGLGKKIVRKILSMFR
jgi:hypothetical protein